MKTQLRNIALITITAGLLLTGTAFANGAKGGGSALLDLTGKRPAVTEKAIAKTMECAKCTTEEKLVTVRENRGGIVRSVATTVHGCPSCSTTSKLVGHGKAKVEQRSHTCGSVQMACCAK